MLQLESVRVSYGGLRALDGVDLQVGKGEFVAIVGPNGAGKTTLFRAISGVVPLESGRMLYEGNDLASVEPHDRAELGIAHVPEGRGTFSELSVWENLRLGGYTRRGNVKHEARRVFEFFPQLESRLDQQAGTLSGGEQQMLALGRAMMARPKLLLLDEPSLGLAPIVVTVIFEALEHMKGGDGMSVLVVEQNASLALAHATRAYVLEVGKVVVEGTGDELRTNESVRRSYLGY